MAKNRKKAEEFILQFCKDIEPTGYNVEQYKKIFADMSDKEFDDYMVGLRDKTKFLVLFKPMYKAKGLTTENNLKVATKYGLDFFERLQFTGNANEPDTVTSIKYLVIDLPYRRQSQTLEKKISLPDNNRIIDQSTYQPTGASKGAKVSFPELQVLIGMGLDNSINELIKFRGGDRGGFSAYNSMMLRYGSVNLRTLNNYATGVESTKTLKSYLLGMHIKQNL